MEKRKPQDARDNRGRKLKLVHSSEVDPLSAIEVTQLRQMLKDMQTIAASCPVARRVLSTR